MAAEPEPATSDRTIHAADVALVNFQGRRDCLATLLSLDRTVLDRDYGVQAAFEHLESVLALGTVSRRVGGDRPDLATVVRRLRSDAACRAGFGVRHGGEPAAPAARRRRLRAQGGERVAGEVVWPVGWAKAVAQRAAACSAICSGGTAPSAGTVTVAVPRLFSGPIAVNA